MGSIYIIKNEIDETVYVGSTKKPLSKRLYEHRKQRNYYPKRRFYEKMRTFGGQYYHIHLLEQVEDPNQLTKREAHWMGVYKEHLINQRIESC